MNEMLKDLLRWSEYMPCLASAFSNHKIKHFFTCPNRNKCPVVKSAC